MRPKHELPLTFTESRLRNAGLGLAALALTAVGVAFALEGTWWAWLVVAFSLFTSVIVIGRTLRPASLHLDADGFDEHAWPARPRRIRWADIDRFDVTATNTSFRGMRVRNEMVGLHFHDPGAHRPAWERPILDRMSMHIDDVLRSTLSYGQDPYHLAGILNDVLAQTRDRHPDGGEASISPARDDERPSPP